MFTTGTCTCKVDHLYKKQPDQYLWRPSISTWSILDFLSLTPRLTLNQSASLSTVSRQSTTVFLSMHMSWSALSPLLTNCWSSVNQVSTSINHYVDWLLVEMSIEGNNGYSSTDDCRSARFDLLALALSELTIEQCITFILLTWH